LSVVGVLAAGCSDSARFDSNPYASNTRQPQPEVTGSIPARPAPASHVTAQPLPPPTRPATVAAAGMSNGARSLAAYRPGPERADVTGSVQAHHASVPSRSAGHWAQEGGSAVVVARGQTLYSIARQHGVPASAIMQANGIRNPSSIQVGQRLVIPRYASGAHVAAAPAAATSTAPVTAPGDVHVVKPGETLIAISRRHNMSLSELARANKIGPYTTLNVGDRIRIPGGAATTVARREPVPKVEPPRTAPVETVASLPTETARVATQEQAPESKDVTKKAEPAGGIPSFRWPVRGRIIAGFGRKPNGSQNDGINLAVPEGTPIKAADDGVVAYAGNELKGYGNLVLIRHDNGYVSAYANASELLVKRGDTVRRGQVIARAGQTGNVNSPQLHFEIRKGSTPVDPTKYLSGA
jgi:murein DD-endopeptidase MepM/ murein hydrolase activator NlpD